MEQTNTTQRQPSKTKHEVLRVETGLPARLPIRREADAPETREVRKQRELRDFTERTLAYVRRHDPLRIIEGI